MKYYLCIVGEFQDTDKIIDDCLKKNIYQYHELTPQKGAGPSINSGDTLILIFKKKIIGYGIADGKLGDLQGYQEKWTAVKIKGEWMQAKSEISLPYGVYSNTIIGTKQSIVKEIDSLWANDLILQISSSDQQSKSELPQEPVIYFHLPTIATFLQKDYLKIPPVQRGKVWNATRVEVLWDSIMRNIPIGTIDIKPVKGGGWEILDGQQRANSIAMGYQTLDEKTLDEKTLDEKTLDKKALDEKRKQAILWVDIGAQKTQPEIDRKFFFRVTTEAHPWGYKLSIDETKNITLNSSERKDAVVVLKNSWKNWNNPGARPYPYELWPSDASLPVPFTVLRSFFERNPEGTFSEFLTYCGTCNPNSNWYKHFIDTKENIDQNTWKCLSDAIGSLNDKVVLAQNSIKVADEDIGLYFKRLNKSGIEPNAEEIRYSLLKSKLPDLQKLDGIAKDRMRPSRMADIAMRTYLIQKNSKWIINIDYENIKELVKEVEEKEKNFENFVEVDFEKKIEKIESWLLYGENNTKGIPRFIFSQLARKHSDLFCLLIILGDSIENIDDKMKMKIIAMITLIMWFDNKINIGDFYQILKPNPTETFEKNIKTWLFKSINNEQLIIPPPSDIFEKIFIAVGSKDMETVKMAWNDPAYIEGIKRIWYWGSEQGRGLLLYVLREYLQKNFGDYDPVDAVWNEENRPWDYDHIFPQSWLRAGRGNRQGNLHELVGKFIHSIGNIAPISFSKNRCKSATCPDEYQGEDDNKLLHVDRCDFFGVDHQDMENDPDQAFKFAEITATRLSKLYNEWYDGLEIAKLLDFSEISNERKELFKKIQKALTGSEFYYTDPDGGFQYECKDNSVDMARPWLSVGVVRNEPRKDFVCVTSNVKDIYIGIRRHPEENSIENDTNKWWHSYETFSMNKDVDKIVETLKALLAQSPVNK